MGKKATVILIIVSICTIMIGSITVLALSSENTNPFYAIGLFFKSAKDKENDRSDGDEKILAKYNGTPITETTVEYYKNANKVLSNTSAEKDPTNRDTIDKIIKNMILLEEAERIGLAATEEEIDVLVQNTLLSYSLPDGKKIIDDFCSGAGITFDEYLELYKEQIPKTLARQKLLDHIGMKYCEAKGLVFTKVNPPAELTAAQEKYVQELFEKNKNKIEYFLE